MKILTEKDMKIPKVCKSKDRQQNGQKKGQNHKQRSTKHTHKIKYRVARTPLKTGGEFRWSGRVAVPTPLVAPAFNLFFSIAIVRQ